MLLQVRDVDTLVKYITTELAHRERRNTSPPFFKEGRAEKHSEACFSAGVVNSHPAENSFALAQ